MQGTPTSSACSPGLLPILTPLPRAAADTTFTTFTRSIGPGIRVLSNSQLSLNNVIFRDIHLIPHPTPNKPFPKGLDHPGFPDVSAVVAYENVLLTLVVRFWLPYAYAWNAHMHGTPQTGRARLLIKIL